LGQQFEDTPLQRATFHGESSGRQIFPEGRPGCLSNPLTEQVIGLCGDDRRSEDERAALVLEYLSDRIS
jgi:hypothetical protein